MADTSISKYLYRVYEAQDTTDYFSYDEGYIELSDGQFMLSDNIDLDKTNLDLEKFAELLLQDYAKKTIQGLMRDPAFAKAMDEHYEEKWAHRFN